ncbi:MAG: DUF4174 domain-containing protein [Chromatiales bacterium]|jgi:hypothetical protein
MPAGRRNRLATAAALLLTAGSVLAGTDLDRYRWEARLLLAFAPSVEAPGWAGLQQRLEQRASALADRDLVVFRVLGHGGSRGAAPLSREDAAALRSRFGVAAEESALILVGKDGGVKRRTTLDAELPDIFRQIDAMPMRRQEMADKRRRGEPVTAP